MSQETVKRKPSVEKPWLALYEEPLPDEREMEYMLNEYLWKRNEGYMNNVALNYFDKKITYQQVKDEIEKASKALLAFGLKKGDIAIICAAKSPEIIYLFYALNRIGVISNMVDPRTSTEGIREYIEEVNAKFICTFNIFYDKVGEAVKGTSVEKVLLLSPAESLGAVKKFAFNLMNKVKGNYADNVVLWNRFIEEGKSYKGEIVEETDPNKAAFMFHTGGTTGNPKCVLLSTKAFNAVAHQSYAYGEHRGERFLDVMPPFIAYGFACGTHLALSHSFETIIIPKIEPEMMAGLMLKYKPQHMAGVPLHFETMVADPKFKDVDLSYLINAGCGGDSLTEGGEIRVNEFFKSHNAPYPVDKGYGLTEVASAATMSHEKNNKPKSIGYPMCFTSVSVFKPGTDEELSYNEEGEICITGPTMMLGYYNKPEETAEAMKLHSDGQVWMHSGDIGVIDEDGYVFIKSRIKRVVIRHDGFKVYATTIENTASKNPDVAACSAVRIKDKEHAHGDLPVLFLTKKETCTKTDEQFKREVKRLCDKMLPEYVTPVAYYVLPKLPYTGIQKVDYKALEEMAQEKGY